MPYAPLSTHKNYYASGGRGDGLLFLHANPFDHRMWLYQIAFFETRYKVIAPDFRGYGRSTRHAASCSANDLLKDVLDILDSEGAETVAVIGASVGSKIALYMAQQIPERVSALVLVGGNPGPSPRLASRIDGFRADTCAYHRAYLSELVAPAFRQTPLGHHLLALFEDQGEPLEAEALEAFLLAANAFDCTPNLGDVRQPTLVVNGALDHSLPVGRKTAEAITRATHRVIDDAGHVCCLERPDVFNQAVATFLGEAT